MLKRNDVRNARVLALELVRSRGAVARLYQSKAQLNSVSLQLNENLGARRHGCAAGAPARGAASPRAARAAVLNSRVARAAMFRAVGHIQKSGELLAVMNSVVKFSAVAKNMTELSREMSRAGMMEEMVTDAMDSALDDPSAVEASETEVEALLAELAAEGASAMPAAGAVRASPVLRAQAAAARAQAQPAQEEEPEEDMESLQARLNAIRA